MKTIYLHVGNFKTGTSAIQKFCSDHRNELLKCDYDYIKSARPRSNITNHGKLPISLAMRYNGYVPRWYDDKETFQQVSKAVVEEIDRSCSENIIISSEEFYRIPGYSAPTVESATSDLRALFSKQHVIVVMYVRRPLDMLKSWYNQANKSNMPTRRFTDFFFYLDNSLLSPQRNAHFWRKCFGSDCLLIEPYDLDGSKHVQRFIELIGVKGPLIVRPSKSQINQKRNENTLELDRVSRIMLLKNEAERNKFLKSFVFQNASNEKKLQDKIQVINREFTAFCQEEKLVFPDSIFGIADLLLHEEKVNRSEDIIPNPFRQKLAQLRNSELAIFLKKARRNFRR